MKRAPQSLLNPDALSYLYCANFKDMAKLINLAGQKFGTLTVISYTGQNKYRDKLWICECSKCGQRAEYIGSSISHGRRLHCKAGCAHYNSKHGEGHRDKEYRAWCHMLRRCYTQTVKEYHRYGGRGITVCPRWLQSYENFLADMGRAPSAKHSLDRIDVNGNYEPGNCRWATVKEQANNQRRTIKVTYQGEVMPLGIFCERFGLPIELIRGRLKMGWDIEKAKNTPKITYQDAN